MDIVGRGVGPTFGPDHGTFQVAVAPAGMHPADVWAAVLASRDANGWIDVRALLDPAPPVAASLEVDWDTVEQALITLTAPDLVVAAVHREFAEGAIWGLLRMLPPELSTGIIWSTCHLPNGKVRQTVVTGEPSPEVGESSEREWQIVARAIEQNGSPVPNRDKATYWLIDCAMANKFPLSDRHTATIRAWVDMAEAERPLTQSEQVAQLRLAEPYGYRTSVESDLAILAFKSPTIDQMVKDEPALGRHILDQEPMNATLRTRVFHALCLVPGKQDPLGLRAGPGHGVRTALAAMAPEQRVGLLGRAVRDALATPDLIRLRDWLVGMGLSRQSIDSMLSLTEQAQHLAPDSHEVKAFARNAAAAEPSPRELVAIMRIVSDRFGHYQREPVRLVISLVDEGVLNVADVRPLIAEVLRGANPRAWLQETGPVLAAIPPDLCGIPHSGDALRYLFVEEAFGGFQSVIDKMVRPDPQWQAITAPAPKGSAVVVHRPGELDSRAAAHRQGAEPRDFDPQRMPAAGRRLAFPILTRWRRSDRALRSEGLTESEALGSKKWRKGTGSGPARMMTIVVGAALILVLVLVFWWTQLADPPADDDGNTNQTIAYERVTTGIADQTVQIANGQFAPALVKLRAGDQLAVRSDNAPVILEVNDVEQGAAQRNWMIVFHEPGTYTVDISGSSRSMSVSVEAADKSDG